MYQDSGIAAESFVCVELAKGQAKAFLLLKLATLKIQTVGFFRDTLVGRGQGTETLIDQAKDEIAVSQSCSGQG